MAEYNNKPIAGILQFIYKKVCYWTGNVSLEEYWDKRPIDSLIWHSIKWAAENNLRLFDFGSTPNDPKSGHYFHKKTWGVKKSPCIIIILYCSPNCGDSTHSVTS